ncbi:MAG: transposase [Lachnospiraceae bacterium]|nr:transposase [Lachnospiraceae bacterium]
MKGIRFETAIIERYRRRKTSIDEVLMEMYLACVSVRPVEAITAVFRGSRVSAGR